MQNRISEILVKKITKTKENSNENLGDFTESVSDLVSFLRKYFPEDKVNSSDIEEIFWIILKKINENWNSEHIKKLFFTLLCYIKREFFIKNKDVWEKLFKEIWQNPETRKYLIEYTDFTIENIYENDRDPYIKIAYLLFLHWIWEEYNLIDDMKKNDLIWINNLVNHRAEELLSSPNNINTKRFCSVLNILNQLTIILSINTEDKTAWSKIFHEILITKTREVIENFLGKINPEFIEKINSSKDKKYFDYSKNFWDQLSKENLHILNLLQDNYWKFLYNFSSNFEYISINENTNKDTVIQKTDEIIDNITHWLLLRMSANFWNLEWEKLNEMENRAKITAQWNIAYTRLIKIKKLRELWIDNSDLKKQEILCIDELVYIYNNLWTNKKRLTSDKDVIENFITLNKPINNEMIITHWLIVFCEFGTEILIKLLNYLLKDDNIWNVHYEKFKIKTIDIILSKFSQKLKMCKDENCSETVCNQNEFKLICNRLIKKIESYIKRNNKENFIYNYWKLYLSIALVYSISDISAQQEKAKTYYLIFLEKFWNNLPIELKDITGKIKINLAKFEFLNDWINPDWIEKNKLIDKWERIINNQIKLFRLEEREKLSSWISKLILWIQRNEFDEKKNSDINVKKEIWKLISESLFNNLCIITIEPKFKKPTIWRFEKFTTIENAYFDILFKYSYIYEDSFMSIFWQVNNHIKDSVIQLIDIYENYASKFQDFKDMTKFAIQIMENKDIYTWGHSYRVKDFSVAIWKMLWYNEQALQELANQATLHDLWKIFIPDNLLKKPWKLTTEEKNIINSHSWRWIMYWIKEWYNRRILEWMAHHSKWYSPKWDPNLTFDGAIEKLSKIPEDKIKIEDYLIFNNLLWINIPIASRIITSPDVIDAVASRRVYDKRSWWTTKQILIHINNELIECSWLKLNEEWKVYPDEKKRRKVEENELNLPYIFLYEWVSYIPFETINKNWVEVDNDIQFDPYLVVKFLENSGEYKKIQTQIMKTDIQLIDKKIAEFSASIEELEKKRDKYELIKANTKETSIEILDKILWEKLTYSESDKKDYERLLEILPILVWYQEKYKESNV